MENSPPIFILIGPPAVGKSSTSRELAARFEKSVHVSVDSLRDMVIGGLLLPNPVWSSALAEQVSLARKNATFITANYQSAGFCVVVDDFLDPNLQADYQDMFTQHTIHKILLFPQQKAAHQRNYVRSNGDASRSYIDEGIRFVYDQMKEMVEDLRQDGWILVDSSEMNLEETVDNILNRTIN